MQTQDSAHDRAGLDAITIMEIFQDLFPEITNHEDVYRLTVATIARFLRDRDAELETDNRSTIFTSLQFEFAGIGQQAVTENRQRT
jgi:hypothetical protein